MPVKRNVEREAFEDFFSHLTVISSGSGPNAQQTRKLKGVEKMDFGRRQGKPLLKPYQHPVSITLYLGGLGTAGLLDDVSQDIGM